MPVRPTYPGVYIEEISSGVRTITGVSTSVAAFIDAFQRGPLNQAIQIFSAGDFQRQFGDLITDSESSYGIQQFFLNGGSEAWVVRVAAPDSGTGGPRAASVILRSAVGGGGQDVLRVTAGRRLKGVSVADPGAWGNNLRVDVDYNSTDPSNLFNLTVSEIQKQAGREVPVQTETYRNLSMSAGPQFVLDVVNDASSLVQLSVDGGWPASMPAQTGTVGTTTPSSAPASGCHFHVNPGSGAVDITLNYSGTVTIQQYRALLESSLRSFSDPLLAGATVEIIGKHFRVTAGRTGTNYSPAIELVFTDVSGTAMTDLGLISQQNVQQYALGATAVVGAQHGDATFTGVDGALPGGTELRGSRLNKTGLYSLEDVDLFNILCLPRTALLSSDTEIAAVYTEAEAYCEERRAFLIVDIPTRITTVTTIQDWTDALNLRQKNAGIYFPRPRIPDPLNGFRLRSFGASGTMAGVYARTDSDRGVWKAPAGIDASLRNVLEFDYKLTDAENGALNPLGINCLRNFPVYGNVAWGARTLQGADVQASDWKYIPVRRFALFLEESLYRGTKWAVFEPNDEPLWAQIRLSIGAFMQNLFRQGAFQGRTPREAYLVKCDSETTTQNDINLGIVNILVGFAPLKPAEFVIIKITQLAGQVEV